MHKINAGILVCLMFLVVTVSSGQIAVKEEVIVFKIDVQNGFRDVFVADLDNDSDMDLISASQDDDMIAWYENIDGLGSFSEQKVITTSANYATDVYVADINGDGFLDVLSASVQDNKIAWYKNNGDGSFGEQLVISTEVYFASCVYAADLDGDGDMDVIAGSISDGGLADVAWFENTDSLGTFGSKNVISTEVSGVRKVITSDLDNDGDMDILSASFADNKIAWYKNLDGLGTFSNQKIITTSAEGAWSVFAADLDNDGDADVLSTSWSVFLNDNRIVWYENIDDDSTFSEQKIISTSFLQPTYIYAADLDNDGDIDVVSGAHNDNLICFENIDGSGDFSTQHVISDSAKGVYSVYCSDIDLDGYLDIIYTSSSSVGDKIAWFKNAASTSIDKYAKGKVQDKIHLIQNYPNPFNLATTIKYFLLKRMDVSVTIYDITG
ncbi:MAG: VCBS repeat-containing protein, partial [Bacteroidales bacterium]|nr:VCBS repeat-containing protein [Bacteroidales bacterium]